MERRSFLAFPLICLLPKTTSPELPPREFHRYSYITDTWTKINKEEINSGDVLRVFDPPDGLNKIVRVTRVDEEQFWADREIDPKTNQWVVY